MASEGQLVSKQTEGKLITHLQEISLREITFSAFTETGQLESSIIVPLQRAYTGRKPVISSRLADTPCTTFGIQGLLDQLNIILGTSHTLDTSSLSSLLKTVSQMTTILAWHMASSTGYGTPMTGALYELKFANGRKRTGRSDEKRSLITRSSIQTCHPDVSGICIATGWSQCGS